jgi:hypothetical protein
MPGIVPLWGWLSSAKIGLSEAAQAKADFMPIDNRGRRILPGLPGQCTTALSGLPSGERQ